MIYPPYTEAKTRKWIVRLKFLKFSAWPLIEWMADQIWPAKYGARNVIKMRDEINALRAVIRSEGTPEIQAAWDAVEEHIDYSYRNLEAT